MTFGIMLFGSALILAGGYAHTAALGYRTHNDTSWLNALLQADLEKSSRKPNAHPVSVPTHPRNTQLSSKRIRIMGFTCQEWRDKHCPGL